LLAMHLPVSDKDNAEKHWSVVVTGRLWAGRLQVAVISCDRQMQPTQRKEVFPVSLEKILCVPCMFV